MRNAVILLACLLGVVAIAGCGGGGGGNGEALSKADYEEAMQALQADLDASTNELQQAFADPQDIPAMTDGLNQASALMDEASQSLDEIEPPEDVADAHQTMVDKSAAAADRLSEFADTVENASLADLQAEADGVPELRRVRRARSRGQRDQGEGVRHRRQLAASP